MKIAQALKANWEKEKKNDTSTSGMIGLEAYLKFNYMERYVKLCHRISIEPVSFGEWLSRDVMTV